MKSIRLGLGSSVLLLSATASISMAQTPADPNTQSVETNLARDLVRELEVKADSQRAVLRQTEGNLERAQALLAVLEGGSPSQEKSAMLRARAEKLQQQLHALDRLSRRPNDPSVRRLRLELSSVRREIQTLRSE